MNSEGCIRNGPMSSHARAPFTTAPLSITTTFKTTTATTTDCKSTVFRHVSYGNSYAAHIARPPKPAQINWRRNIPHADPPECKLVTDDDDNTMTRPNMTNEETMIRIQKNAADGFSSATR